MGQQTGPITGKPPSASDETKAALLGASKSDPVGQHEGGMDGGDKQGEGKVKSEKEGACPASYYLEIGAITTFRLTRWISGKGAQEG